MSCSSEQYDQAILDFKECLAIQKEYLEAEDRLLAETYYQLGLAYTFDKQYDPAIENFKSAASVIEARIGESLSVVSLPMCLELEQLTTSGFMSTILHLIS